MIFIDDCARRIQSVMEAAEEVASLSGVTTKKTVLAVGPKKTQGEETQSIQEENAGLKREEIWSTK
jgi:hypothetical protein